MGGLEEELKMVGLEIEVLIVRGEAISLGGRRKERSKRMTTIVIEGFDEMERSEECIGVEARKQGGVWRGRL